MLEIVSAAILKPGQCTCTMPDGIGSAAGSFRGAGVVFLPHMRVSM